MKRRTSLVVGLAALVSMAAAALLLACTADGTRTPFTTTAGTNETTAPESPSAAPTTSATQVSPSKPAGDAGSTTTPDDCKRAAPSNACGVVPQCGCAPTETCDVTDAKGTAVCVTAGKAPMGQPCTSTPGCALGLTCIFGTCHAFCDDPSAACTQPGTGACSQIKTKNGTDVPNLAICRVACAPHDAASCGGKTTAGTGVCVIDGHGGTDCQSGGTRGENESCSPTDECGPALVCATKASTSTCKRWCRIGQNDCGAGKTCVGFQTEVKVGNVVYGACP